MSAGAVLVYGSVIGVLAACIAIIIGAGRWYR